MKTAFGNPKPLTRMHHSIATDFDMTVVRTQLNNDRTAYHGGTRREQAHVLADARLGGVSVMLELKCHNVGILVKF